ncbi:MAG: acetyl-CoA carboxylase biotin carboxyl carrier protein subunit [Cyclobacteriaceae bacterium]|nr:acetyl-CoA carboxylase biotin carboxyl carrier protein subunit [Cyclobacteriaceae bacterium]
MIIDLESPHQTYSILREHDRLVINGETFDGTIKSTAENHYFILLNNRCIHAEIKTNGNNHQVIEILINGKTYTFNLKTKSDILYERVGMKKPEDSKKNDLVAPMPGMVLDIKVKEGDEVKPGDPLLILEAMKMENMIKSDRSGKIAVVEIQKGQGVEKNQVLFRF